MQVVTAQALANPEADVERLPLVGDPVGVDIPESPDGGDAGEEHIVGPGKDARPVAVE